ncbi:metallophosphoesterase [Oenococcus alcoholitolerans]|uniref:metallophosphoesterase n=1 Tax=Oenococcus alcoholitolerans TaxID=931074 RepID=UPI003F72BBCF
MNKFELHNELEKVILVSDIHGNWQALKKITEIPEFDSPGYRLIFLGDYTDWNGQEKREPIKVITFIMNQVKNHRALAIHGNHDDMLYKTALGDSATFYNWGRNGIIETQEAMGLTPNDINIELTKTELNDKFAEYVDFLDKIPYAIEDQKRLFIHAGLDWSKKDYHQTSKEDMVWIRDEYFFSDDDHSIYGPSAIEQISPVWHKNNTGKVIVAGHTPTYLISGDINDPIVRMQHDKNDPIRYDIDGGSHSAQPGAALNVLILDKDGSELKSYRLAE